MGGVWPVIFAGLFRRIPKTGQIEPNRPYFRQSDFGPNQLKTAHRQGAKNISKKVSKIRVFGNKIDAVSAAQIKTSAGTTRNKDYFVESMIELMGESAWLALSDADRDLAVITWSAVEEASDAKTVDLKGAAWASIGGDRARQMIRQIVALNLAAVAGCPLASDAIEDLSHQVANALPLDVYAFVS